MSLKVGDNIAKFMSRIPGIHRHREVVQPNLGLFVACADVNMGRLADFVGIEEGAIRTPAQNRRQSASLKRQIVVLPGRHLDLLALEHGERARDPAARR